MNRTPPRPPRTPPQGFTSSTGRRGRQASLDPVPLQIQDGPKKIYFIRHGQSLAQCNGRLARLTDSSLLDCTLSPLGIEQSQRIPDLLDMDSIELVVTSPLTRALQTALIAFSSRPIPMLIHYDLREVGSSQAPENVPRDMNLVLADLQGKYNLENLDTETLQPTNWPRRHDMSPRVVRRVRVLSFVTDFLAQRPEKVIAVVAHYNVIQTALSVQQHQKKTNFDAIEEFRPRNAVPIPCLLDQSGIQMLEEEEQRISAALLPPSADEESHNDEQHSLSTGELPLEPVDLEQTFASLDEP